MAPWWSPRAPASDAHALEQQERLERRAPGRLVERADLDREIALVAHGRRRGVELAPHGGGDGRERDLAQERVRRADALVADVDHPRAPQEAERLDQVDVLVEHARRAGSSSASSPQTAAACSTRRAPAGSRSRRAAMMSASVRGTAPDSSRRKRRSCST